MAKKVKATKPTRSVPVSVSDKAPDKTRQIRTDPVTPLEAAGVGAVVTAPGLHTQNATMTDAERQELAEAVNHLRSQGHAVSIFGADGDWLCQLDANEGRGETPMAALRDAQDDPKALKLAEDDF